MSIESVQTELGDPADERRFEGEPEVQMLFYGRWQLIFENGRLERRIKYVFERPIPDPAVVDQREKDLRRHVLSLKSGASMSSVKAELGPPDTYEIAQNTPREEVILTYQLWELTFAGGVLAERIKR